ncbi:MAG: SURF1 family protein [Pseudomonadota bacterium]|nr:SURF1 family protein [Pseudomonadota bacterium]
MASDRDGPEGWRAFPFGLTIAAAIALSILLGLGVWQLHRLKWKQGLLAKIAALQGAPALPLGPVLARVAAGETGQFIRVSALCAPPARPSPMIFRYALHDGQVGWRAVTMCALAGAPYDGILLDRGLVTRFTGAMAPGRARFPAPLAVTGVLRGVGAASPLDPAMPQSQNGVTVLRVVDTGALAAVARQSGLAHPAPYILAVEAETPPPAGIAPAALPQDIPNNHFVYALTWFALAGILAWFYVAMVWRRLAGR